MSNVIRLSNEMTSDLAIFKSKYLSRLELDIQKHDESKFLKSIYQEKKSYSDSEWVSFVIRFACNHVDD